MSNWNDLLDDLGEHQDEELERDQVADLWILLSARSGSYAAGTVLVALADVDVAVRAVSHAVSPVDDRLSAASRRFLLNLVAHSSARDIEEWVDAAKRTLTASGELTNPEIVLAELQAVLSRAGEGQWLVGRRGTGKAHLVVQYLAERLTPDERLTAAAELASLHPDLVHEESANIRSLLATAALRDRLVDELAGDPRQIVGSELVADSYLRQARIAGEAIASIWEYAVLEPAAAALELGAKASNREKVRTYRERSWLLGLPRGRSYVYPQFQFNPESRDVYAEVRSANEMLDAAHDPWGTASWWIGLNDRLASRPIELVGTSRASEITVAAQAVLESVG
jgi:hypothetical protein